MRGAKKNLWNTMAGTRVPQNDGLIITKNWSAMENDFRYRWCASRRRQNMILYKRKLIKREEARNEKFYSIPNYFGFWPHSLSLSAWQRHTPTYRKSATNRMEMQKHHFFAFLFAFWVHLNLRILWLNWTNHTRSKRILQIAIVDMPIWH